jgi:hypothetical protein
VKVTLLSLSVSRQSITYPKNLMGQIERTSAAIQKRAEIEELPRKHLTLLKELWTTMMKEPSENGLVKTIGGSLIPM